MAVAGDLVVNLRANTKGFMTGINKTKLAVKKFRTGLNNAVYSVRGFTSALAAAAGIGGMGALIKSSFTAIDELAKTSKKLGISTEALVGFQLAARESGASSEQLNTSLKYMENNIAEAASGIGEAKAAFEGLNLNARYLMSLSPDQQFLAIAEAMKKQTVQAKQMQLARDIFGRSGGEILPMLNMETSAINEAVEAAKQLGWAFTEAEKQAIEKANDAVGRMKLAIQGVSNQVAINLAPTVEAIAKNFTAATSGAETFAGIGQKIAMSFARVGDVVQTIQYGFYKLREFMLNMLAAIIEGIKTLTDTVVKLLNKIPGVEAKNLMTGDTAATFREHAKQARVEAAKIAAQRTPSEILAKQIAQQKLAADAGPEVKAASAQQMAIADSIGARVGQWIGKASGMAVTGAAAGVSSFAGAAGGMFGQGKQGNMAANKAIEANTVEGFKALRANLRSDPQKKIAELNKKQLDELMKGNSLTERVLGAIQSAGDLISIPL